MSGAHPQRRENGCLFALTLAAWYRRAAPWPSPHRPPRLPTATASSRRTPPPPEGRLRRRPEPGRSRGHRGRHEVACRRPGQVHRQHVLGDGHQHPRVRPRDHQRFHRLAARREDQQADLGASTARTDAAVEPSSPLCNLALRVGNAALHFGAITVEPRFVRVSISIRIGYTLPLSQAIHMFPVVDSQVRP